MNRVLILATAAVLSATTAIANPLPCDFRSSIDELAMVANDPRFSPRMPAAMKQLIKTEAGKQYLLVDDYENWRNGGDPLFDWQTCTAPPEIHQAATIVAKQRRSLRDVFGPILDPGSSPAAIAASRDMDAACKDAQAAGNHTIDNMCLENHRQLVERGMAR